MLFFFYIKMHNSTLSSLLTAATDADLSVICQLGHTLSGMGIKNGKVSWKVGVWGPQKAPSGGQGGGSWSFLTKKDVKTA